jgi:hypothetical protein
MLRPHKSSLTPPVVSRKSDDPIYTFCLSIHSSSCGIPLGLDISLSFIGFFDDTHHFLGACLNSNCPFDVLYLAFLLDFLSSLYVSHRRPYRYRVSVGYCCVSAATAV